MSEELTGQFPGSSTGGSPVYQAVPVPAGAVPPGSDSDSGSDSDATASSQPLNSAPLARPAAGYLSAADAAELHARREAEAKAVARRHGWKPIVIWYLFWGALLAFGSISELGSGQSAGLAGLVFAGACLWYSYYLYHGGRRRVWFVIW